MKTTHRSLLIARLTTAALACALALDSATGQPALSVAPAPSSARAHGIARAAAGTTKKLTPRATLAPSRLADPWSPLPPLASLIDWSAQLASPTVGPFGLPFSMVAGPHALPGPSSPPAAAPVRGVCEDVALAARIAAMDEARADYIFEIAKCINLGGCIEECIRKLGADYEDARTLAEEQYRARLRVCTLLGGGGYAPKIEPREFSSKVTNQYFPLVPGRTLVYRKRTREGVEETRVTTLRDTVEIADVECAIVRDVVRLDGDIIEDTVDWFAQHKNGDVWYFGEIARNYEDELLDNLDGSWRTGKDGALPGILMKGSPRIGDAHRQEFLLNEAEDVAVVISLGETVTVPAGTFRNCIQTEEFTPLEPGSGERKYFAPRIGFVLGVSGGGTRTEVVRIIDS